MRWVGKHTEAYLRSPAITVCRQVDDRGPVAFYSVTGPHPTWGGRDDRGADAAL